MDPLEVAAHGYVFTGRAAGPVDGRLVLLLHGFPQSSWSWRRVAPALARAGYRAVAVDQRGYSPGARPVGVEHYTAAHLAADAAALVGALGHDRADLVGHDWGAAVGWQTAGRHPEAVRSLTAVSVPHPRAFAAALRTDDEQREMSAYMRIFQQPGRAEALLGDDGFAGIRRLYAGHLTEDDVEHHLAVLAQPGALTAALNWYRAMADGVLDLGPITAPTLYVWSDGDAAIGRAAALGTADQVEGRYRFRELAGVSHWVPEQAPEALTEALLDHLASS